MRLGELHDDLGDTPVMFGTPFAVSINGQVSQPVVDPAGLTQWLQSAPAQASTVVCLDK